MSRQKTFGVVLALVMGSTAGATALYAQEDERVNSPNAIHEQKDKHFDEVVKVLNTLGTPETAYDYVTFGLSGPVVVLQDSRQTGPSRTTPRCRSRSWSGSPTS